MRCCLPCSKACYTEIRRKEPFATMVTVLFYSVKDISILLENVAVYLEKAMKIAAKRGCEGYRENKWVSKQSKTLL